MRHNLCPNRKDPSKARVDRISDIQSNHFNLKMERKK